MTFPVGIASLEGKESSEHAHVLDFFFYILFDAVIFKEKVRFRTLLTLLVIPRKWNALSCVHSRDKS